MQIKQTFAKFKNSIAVLTAVSVLFPTIALADRYREQVAAQLILFGVNYIQAGWTSSHDPYLNTLRSNYTQDVTYYLNAGNTYHIFGVCDEDCSDIDLYFYDGNGNLITKDTGIDGYPLLQVYVSRSGSYRIKVRMFSCSTIACRYGLSAFIK